MIETQKKNLQAGDARFFETTQRAYIFGAVAHALSIISFYYFGIQEMVLFNVFVSVPSFLLAIFINRAGRINTAFAIAFVEIFIHQIIGVYYTGWAGGLQFWLVYLAGLCFFNPTWHGKLRIAFLLSLLSTLGLLYRYAYVGVYVLPDTTLDILYLTNLFSAIGVLVLLINYYSRSAHTAEAELKVSHQKLDLSHREARSLLLNILPESIADRLTGEQKQIADSFENASILFTDLVGFTKLSAKLTPEAIVAMLNGVIYEFDRIVEESGLEKIKTIGDGYMAAAGIPIARPNHARAALECARKMLVFMDQYNRDSGSDLQLRVGISSGPIVAGVIGKNKFTYDLWGDPVNTASRMESSGVPGLVHVSQSTYQEIASDDPGFDQSTEGTDHSSFINGDRVADPGQYTIKHRGKIDIKGKGLMDTYLISFAADSR